MKTFVKSYNKKYTDSLLIIKMDFDRKKSKISNFNKEYKKYKKFYDHNHKMSDIIPVCNVAYI